MLLAGMVGAAFVAAYLSAAVGIAGAVAGEAQLWKEKLPILFSLSFSIVIFSVVILTY